MLVDLHIHTYHSDGTMSPREIVKKAKEKNIKVISITDHNKIDSWNDFYKEAIEAEIVPIKGVEINVKHNDKVFHLLAYNFDETDELIKLINNSDSEMQRMSTDLIEKLSKEYESISIDDFDGYKYNQTLGGWKGLHYLYDRGITKKLFDGFRYYSDYDCGYEKYKFPELSEVCKQISIAKGYSVLAHPGEYFKDLPRYKLLTELDNLKEKGIQGIECYYPTHDKSFTDICVEFCNNNNLLITCGSDEHGEFGKHAKTIDQSIGCMNISIDKLNIDALLEIVQK